MIAQTVGRFTLLRKLPAGGMGRVFEAEDSIGGRRVALKLIDLGSDVDSMQIVEAERVGADLQKRLSDVEEHVTKIYDFGEIEPDYFYICMEYVEGRDLSELMTPQGIAVAEAVRIAQSVLEVLDRAHNFPTNINGRASRGIVHGDLKPRNIRITPTGDVKVLDFGIAKALSMTRTFTQNMFGSVAYSSPERLSSGEVNISSDLWAVAVVLYEMLAGRAYFVAESAPKLEYSIRNYREVQPMPQQAPEGLKRIMRRALSPEPSARYLSAADFATALRNFASGVSTEEDTEATRRITPNGTATGGGETVRTQPAADTEPTRRVTAKRQPVPQDKIVAKRSILKTILRVLSIFVFVVILIAVFLVVNEYIVWQDADKLARDLVSEKQQNLDAAWQQYQKVSSRSNVPVSLWSAQSALRDRLMGDADRVVAQSREPEAPVVTEAEWVKARGEVARALQLDPGNKSVHGTLRLIDGQIARIRGTSRHDARLLEESRQDFEDSTRYLKTADPWLGLARLYIYSLHDVDHGEEALKEAERRGHDLGKRETTQLADGYRFRAEQTMRVGDQSSSAADAERYYEMARDDVAHARKLYESVLPWPGTDANLKRLDGLLMHMSEASNRERAR